MGGKTYHSGNMPKALKPYRDNISVKQKTILSRYLDHVNKQSEADISYFETDAGQKGVDVAMKLELKEQQIEAQKALGSPTANPLLILLKEADKADVIDVTPVVKEIGRIDKMPFNKLDKECIADINTD